MSVKIHYLHSNLDLFSVNLGNMTGEKGKHFHQDLKIVETKYQERSNCS